jgi:hypothetical protein
MDKKKKKKYIAPRMNVVTFKDKPALLGSSDPWASGGGL